MTKFLLLLVLQYVATVLILVVNVGLLIVHFATIARPLLKKIKFCGRALRRATAQSLDSLENPESPRQSLEELYLEEAEAETQPNRGEMNDGKTGFATPDAGFTLTPTPTNSLLTLPHSPFDT